MSFDPNMTYWQSLKIVAKELATNWPIRPIDVANVIEGAKLLVWGVGSPILRLTVTLALPISDPLLTLAVQAERRKITKAKAKRAARNAEEFRRMSIQEAGK